MSVFIATPTYDGKLHWATSKGIVGAAYMCAKANIGFAADVIPHDAFVQKGRATLVNRFLASGMRDLLFVDADIGFEPEDVATICKAAPDVVCGLYLMKTNDATPRYPALMCDPIVRHPSDMRLIKMQYAPTGFMRIRRHALERMIAAWPEDYWIDGMHGKVYDLFPAGRYGHEFTGEDIKFCEKLINCGLDLWAMQGIKLRHFGERSWDSCWQIDRAAPEGKAEMGATVSYMPEKVAA